MNATPLDLRDDETFLDDALDLAVEELSAGGPPNVRSLCGSRPHLLGELELALAAARQAIGGGPSRPDIPGYEVIGKLGHGGMGSVYLAQEQAPQRVVALKIMNGPWSMMGRLRFLAEATTLRGIEHPNIVPVFGTVEAQDNLCFTMQWIDGWNLAELMQCFRSASSDRISATGPRERWAVDPIRFVCEIGVAIARALDHVHGKGLLHRDVKPGNILIDRACKPWLSDFGLVRDFADESHTQSGAFVGTAAYAAPEQLRGARHLLSARTDVFGLGATLYECLTGALPFGGDHATAILRRIELADVADLRSLAVGAPRELQTIVHRALEADPANRYPSAGALADDLARFLQRQPIMARPPGLIRSAARWARRRPLPATLAAVVLLAIPSASAWQFYALPRLRLAHAAEEEQEFHRVMDRGWLALDERRFDAAEQDLRRAVDLRPDDVLALFGLASVLLHENRLDAAMEVLDSSPAAAPSLMGPRARLEAKLAGRQLANEDLPEPRSAAEFVLAADRMFWGHGDDAQPDYRRALELAKEAIVRSTPQMLRAHSLRCRAAVKLRDRKEAEAAIDAMLIHFPASAVAWHQVGQTRKAYGDTDGAIAAFGESIRIDPRLSFAHNDLGNTLKAIDRLPDAERSLRAAVAADPEYAVAHYNLGNVLIAQSRWLDAELSLRTAIALDPEFRSSLLNLGIALNGARQFDAAIEVLLQYGADSPSPRTHRALGDARGSKGDLEGAAAHYRAAASGAPLEFTIAAGAARGLIRLGRIDEGVVLLEQALTSMAGSQAERDSYADFLADAKAVQDAEATDPTACLVVAARSARIDLQRTATLWAERAFALDDGAQRVPEHRIFAAECAVRAAGADCPEGAALDHDQRSVLLRKATAWMQDARVAVTSSAKLDTGPSSAIVHLLTRWDEATGPLLPRDHPLADDVALAAEMAALRDSVTQLRAAVMGH